MKSNLIIVTCALITTFITAQNNSFPTPSGIVQINSSPILTNPTNKLEIHETSGNGNHVGIGGVAPVIKFYGGNTVPSGFGPFTSPFGKLAMATGNMQFIQSAAAGDFIIQNMGTSSPIAGNGKSILFSSRFQNGNGVEQMRLNEYGNLSIGTDQAYNTNKLYVNFSTNPSGAWQWGTKSYITQITSVTGGGSYLPFIGVEGKASTNFAIQSDMRGVVGTGSNGMFNYGGLFEGDGSYGCNGDVAYGVKAVASGGEFNYGIWAESGGHYTGCGVSYAGYFNGDVVKTGWDNFTSDRKLKKDITPLKNTLEKILKLKPSSYQFRNDEFKTLNLPQGPQMGLIAQELEQVIPELVTTIPANNKTDDRGNVIEHTPEFKAVRYVNLIPLLIGGMQEQQTEIASQAEVIQSQQQQIDELKTMVRALASNFSENKTVTGLAINISDKNTLVLNQNAPNPFLESTVITYNIPDQFTTAQIIFRTNDGRTIKTLDIAASGKGSLTIFADDLSKGTYLYSIVIDGKIKESKTMVKE